MNLASAAAGAPMAAGCVPMVSALPANQLPAEVRGQPLKQTPSQSPPASTSRLGEQFARALAGQGADEEAAPPHEAELPAALLPWPPAPPTPSLGMAPPSAPPAGVAHASSDAVTAAAKARDLSAAAPATVSQADAGQVWELSLNEPDGLVLSLRAERVAQPAGIAGNPPPGWTLAITAPAAEAAALQRHASRLAERLTARALAPAHLRIAADRDPHGE